MVEQLQFFASLDFPPERTTLGLKEIAKKLGCTPQHLRNEIEEHAFIGLDLKGAAATRSNMRIPVECYRNYVLNRLTGAVDFKMRFLRDLPAATRRELIAELQASLKTNP